MTKKSFLAIFILFLTRAYSAGIPDELLPFPGKSQERKSCSRLQDHMQEKKGNFIQESDLVRRPYDVLFYDIFLDWKDLLETGQKKGDILYEAVNTIVLKIDSAATDELVFDCADLHVDSVRIDDSYNAAFLNNKKQLVVFPATVPAQGETLFVKIFYKNKTNQEEGFYFYKKSLPVTMENLAYTMSQPNSARRWMPCNDIPYDKAMSKVTVRIPSGYSAASNGLLSTKLLEEGAERWVWQNNDPVSTYLMAVTASKYDFWEGKFNALETGVKDVPIYYYAWKPDVGAEIKGEETYNAKYSYKGTVPMMRFLISKFGDYAFEKYGLVPLAPFWAGGMEHQTMTSVNREWLKGHSSSGFLHEHAHHWFGDNITCETWDDIWINEGGATYAEALWLGNQYGQYKYKINLDRRDYMENGGINAPAMYGLDPDSVLWFYSFLIYDKASVVYHMLSMVTGEEDFYKSMRHLLSKHGKSSVSTEQFALGVKETVPDPKIDLDTFFDQWVYKAGHPVFRLIYKDKGETAEQKRKITVTFEQIQRQLYPDRTDIPETFRLPVILSCKKDGETVNTEVLVTENTQVADIVLPWFPDSIRIDTLTGLYELHESIVSVEQPEENVTGISLYPNPVSSGSSLYLSGLPERSGRIIKVLDMLGREVPCRAEEFSGGLAKISPHGFAPGQYFISVGNENTSPNVLKFVVKN